MYICMYVHAYVCMHAHTYLSSHTSGQESVLSKSGSSKELDSAFLAQQRSREPKGPRE